jgi:hypothetical protein
VARDGGRAPEAGEDGAEEEDGEEADARSMGMRSPGGWGRFGRKLAAFRGPTAADRRRGRGARASVGRWMADFETLAAAENPVGQRTGALRKVAVGEDDGGYGGGGHDDDDGGRSGTKKWPSAGGGGSLLLYIDTPLVPGRVTNRDKMGAFCHGW